MLYRNNSGRVHCEEEYIVESGRISESPPQLSIISNTTGDTTTIENFRIVRGEEQNLYRSIKNAIFLSINDPYLNRNVGKYHLQHIGDDALMNTPELKI